jgi:DMSO/TMAO reductase YedYZ molybdopterin-dependent catalytic subunit
MMKLFQFGLSVLFFSVALVVQAQADQPRMSETLSVFGAVKQEKTFSLNDLKQLAGLQLQNVEVMCMSGANKGQMENLTGVALKTLLEHVGL